MAKKERKVSIFEIIWYSVSGAIALWGLTFITLGVIVRNLKSTSDLAKADAAFKAAMKLNYFTWGIVTLVVGLVLALIVLLITAKKADREVEKQQRRAARLATANVVEEQPTEPAAE